MKIPKLAIFDMDGLIFDTERLFMEKQAPVLRKYGYCPRKEDYIRTLGTNGQTLKKILTCIYGDNFPADKISEETRAAVDSHIASHGLVIKPGIRELLVFFKQNSVMCVVATSTREETAGNYIRISGLDQFFTAIIGGDRVRRCKPDPEIFLEALKLTPFQKSEALIIEDSEMGILAADAAKIPVVCIPDLKEPEPPVRDIPVCIVKNASELIGCFKQP